MKKTYWPHGIIASIIAIIIACGYTIYYSLDYPVHMDNFFLTKYQDADKNYNELQISQANFEKQYHFDPTPKPVNKMPLEVMDLPKNRTAYVVSKDGFELTFATDAPLKEAKILLTRPDTSEYDKELAYKLAGGLLIVSADSLPQNGRWQLAMLLTASEDAAAFYKVELFAK